MYRLFCRDAFFPLYILSLFIPLLFLRSIVKEFVISFGKSSADGAFVC